MSALLLICLSYALGFEHVPCYMHSLAVGFFLIYVENADAQVFLLYTLGTLMHRSFATYLLITVGYKGHEQKKQSCLHQPILPKPL